ncbi:hypothetical protein [Chryseobacterium gambrini]|uniref:Uncharacterized protein n=1 Tax=Chryseobacterium gambrini TaxID=373672 RepID=A0A1N7QW39_9FLAO|nr:hypothetical protein [Chryseobacterium gambrini]SIT27056.1 hypothetical protein SAMN05421785_12019 [Chryseobacterium gambrini]
MENFGYLTFIHPGLDKGKISETFRLYGNMTTVNRIRNSVRAWAGGNNIEESIDQIELQLSDGRKILYKTIQTKRGLATKGITWDELFKRGGKIFD